MQTMYTDLIRPASQLVYNVIKWTLDSLSELLETLQTLTRHEVYVPRRNQGHCKLVTSGVVFPWSK